MKNNFFIRCIFSLFRNKFREQANDEEEAIQWELLQKFLGCKIKQRNIYITALRHSSCQGNSEIESLPSYERLEFLGDAVLSLLTGEFLFFSYPDASEGSLTQMRSKLVSQVILARKAREYELGEFLLLGPGEEKTGGRNKDSILAGSLEALIGALYVDRGLECTKHFIQKQLFADYKKILTDGEVNNFKGDLLEYCQRVYKKPPRYVLIKSEGAEHLKSYTFAVQIGDKVLGEGKGYSKKEAEQHAAEQALEKIKGTF